MKKNILLLLLTLFSFNLIYAQASTIEPELQDVLNQKSDEMISVNIILKSQADVQKLQQIAAKANDRKTKSGYSQTVSVTARLDETVSLENAADFLPSQQPTPKKSNEAEISRTHFGVNNFIY